MRQSPVSHHRTTDELPQTLYRNAWSQTIMPHPADCLCGRSQLFTFAPDTPKPEFWFGDSVSFCWNDEHTEEPFSETGEIIGCAWNPRENFWEYLVVWVSSTAYPDLQYPIFDGNFVTAGEVCKL